MKTINLLLLTLLGINTVLFAQECGTPSDTQNQDFSSLRKKGIEVNTTFTVNVYFHIVRNSNGTGGFNSSNIDLIVNNLNSVYNPYNIFINKLGMDFIDNSTYYNLSNSEFSGLIGLNNVPNAINFYLVNSAPYGGRVERILSKNLVVVNDSALTSTSEHEIGHCLNLYHTHHGTWVCERDTTTCIEVDGVSNSTCGDYIGDTPADPGLLVYNSCRTPTRYIVNTSCVYIGSSSYNPLANNIMSYSRKSCRTNFTQGQADRIRRALSSSSLLQRVVVPELSSIDNLCFSNSKTLTININSNTTTWQVSSNVSVLSKNNTSITVRALNSSSTGSGWVKATLSNGVDLKEEFNVGVLTSYSYGNISIHHSSMSENLFLNNWTRMWIEGDYSGNNWEWTANYSMIRGNNTSAHMLIKPIVLGYITVKARRKNDCGNGDWISKNYYVTERPEGGYHFSELDRT